MASWTYPWVPSPAPPGSRPEVRRRPLLEARPKDLRAACRSKTTDLRRCPPATTVFQLGRLVDGKTMEYRGRKDDPLYRPGSFLTKAHERLDDRGDARLRGLLRLGPERRCPVEWLHRQRQPHPPATGVSACRTDALPRPCGLISPHRTLGHRGGAATLGLSSAGQLLHGERADDSDVIDGVGMEAVVVGAIRRRFGPERCVQLLDGCVVRSDGQCLELRLRHRVGLDA